MIPLCIRKCPLLSFAANVESVVYPLLLPGYFFRWHGTRLETWLKKRVDNRSQRHIHKPNGAIILHTAKRYHFAQTKWRHSITHSRMVAFHTNNLTTLYYKQPNGTISHKLNGDILLHTAKWCTFTQTKWRYIEDGWMDG